MKKLIDWKVDLVRDAQQKLLSLYETSGQDGGAPGIDKSWAHEYTFIFALSHWSSAMMKFAVGIHDPQKLPKKQGFCEMVKGQLISTFAFSRQPGGMFAPQHLNFVVRNFISISLAFFFGICLHHMGFTMYRPYSATMAGTLSLLISNVGGSAMEKNLKRLLGVVLGKVIPIIILGNLDYFGCQNTDRFVTQAVAVFIFIFAFEYIYFTSPSWGYVGGLIAAFGCYPLMTYPTCVGFHDDGASTYVANYQELCEVTTCILLQMFVDVLLEHESARNHACDLVEWTTDRAAVCIDNFFQGSDAQDLKKIRSEAMSNLDKAYAMVADVDPVKLVAPGADTPFNVGLYQQSLDVLRLLLSDLSMIIMAIHEVKDHQQEESTQSEATMKKILKDLTSWTRAEGSHRLSFQDDVRQHVDEVAKVVLLILRKTEEAPLDNPKDVVDILKSMEGRRLGRAVLGKQEMFADCRKWEQQGSQMSKQESGSTFKETAVKDVFAVRISVIVVACDNIVKHMGELAQLCVEANIH